jgi:hypothetical protein
MKLVSKIAFIALASAGLSNAATVTISSGLSSQGVTVSQNGVALTSFNVSIGNWDGSTFTVFGSTFSDSDKINGARTATDTFFNGKAIHVLLSTGTTIANSGTQWVVFARNAVTNFPANVVPAGNTTWTFSSSSVVSILANGDPTGGLDTEGNKFTTANNFDFVPEPSVALLGALGALGLIRRRR